MGENVPHEVGARKEVLPACADGDFPLPNSRSNQGNEHGQACPLRPTCLLEGSVGRTEVLLCC